MRSHPVLAWISRFAVLAILTRGLGVVSARAEVPTQIPFQGRVAVNGVPFDGDGRFKFVLLASRGAPPTTVTVWSHDGTGLGGLAEPTSNVILPVQKGLYSVRLGDPTVPNMTLPLSATVLTNLDVRLRVWFDDGMHGMQLLQPDQPLGSVGYALRAAQADSAEVAEGLTANQTFAGVSTFSGPVTQGAMAATEALNVAGNIQVQNDSSLFGLDRLVGYNDLRLFGDSGASPDLYVGADGRIGIGTTLLNSQVNISGPDNNGLLAGLQIDSGGQRMLLDGNEIDSNGILHLNFNGPHDITLANGGGRVSVGNIPATERLNVAGNIQLADNGDIRGLDDLVGFDGLKLWGDSNAADFLINASGNIGHRVSYGNVSFNIRGDIFNGETQVLRVEDFFGLSILEVQSDRDVFVVGDFHVSSGSKNFVIDHPQALAEKILRHNTVEGPDYYTFYQGRVQLDAQGEAWVALPAYFQALNAAPLYQLTCIGGFAPVYVAEEVADNRFKIAGGTPGLHVCWQVTATRNDPYVRDHPYQAEADKAPDERGRFHYPAGYGAQADQALNRRVTPDR